MTGLRQIFMMAQIPAMEVLETELEVAVAETTAASLTGMLADHLPPMHRSKVCQAQFLGRDYQARYCWLAV
jgi:hypothetical protein